jgi:hypothetical protein
MRFAFSISLVSGALLLMLDARLFLTMPAFYIKLAAIVVALLIIRLLGVRALNDERSADTGPVPRKIQVLAAAVLICWIVAITAGRVTAYVPEIGLQSAAAVVMAAAVLLIGRYIAVRLLALSRH